MADDLDVSDLAEVRRRVVEPVLSSVIAQGELTIVSLGYEQPSGWAGSWADDVGGPRRAWLVLSADEGQSCFEHPIGKAIFWRTEAEYEAAFLASELDEWICLCTKFGWGGGHGVRHHEVPGPVWPEHGVLEVFPAERVSLPIWQRGEQMSAAELGLSTELTRDLISWHRHLDEATQAMDAEVAGPRPADVREGFEEFGYAAYKRAMAALRAAGYNSWADFVDVFESWRDDLIERLRAEVAPAFTVSTPLRIPR